MKGRRVDREGRGGVTCSAGSVDCRRLPPGQGSCLECRHLDLVKLPELCLGEVYDRNSPPWVEVGGGDDGLGGEDLLG